MSCDASLEAIKGDTYTHIFLWANPDVLIKKAITAIPRAGICVVTAVGHGLTNRWPFRIESVKGMTEINNEILQTNQNNAPIKFGKGANGEDKYTAANVTSDTVELNDVNSSDFTAWSSGGYIVYEAPKVLTGCTARLQVKTDKSDTTASITLTEVDGITLDNTNKLITVVFSATRTALLSAGKYYFDLQITEPGSVFSTIIAGILNITEEVTTG